MFRKLLYLVNRSRLERELAEEMQFHAEQAGAQFGDVVRWRERSRDEWGWRGVDETVQDVRYALRSLRKQPGFAIAAFLLLTFGVTANTAVFSVVRSVILSSLPVRDPGALVQLAYYDPAENEIRPNHTHIGFEMFVKEARTVRDLFGFSAPLEANGIVNGSAGPIHAQAVTANAFEVLGAGAAVQPGEVAVSRGYAQRRGLAPGSVVTINAIPFTVAKVLPKGLHGFAVGETADVYFHADRVNEVLMRNARHPGNMWLRIMGRLQPGVSIVQAQAELEPIARRCIENLYANLPAGFAQVRKVIDAFRFTVIPAHGGAHSELRDSARTPLLILLGTAALLLFAACANLAGLALARSVARQREFGIRIVLGCGRGRLLRQMLTESMLIACAAGGAALLLEPVARRIIAALVVDVEVGQPDGMVLAFLFAITVLAGTLVGIVPAWRVCSNARLVDDRMARSPRFARTLIAAQVAISLVLLAGAGLFVQTFRSYRNIDPGFRRESLVSVGVNLGSLRYKNEQLLSYYRAGLERLRNVPGVSSVTLSRWPMGELNWTTVAESGGVQDRASRNLGGPQFAATMGMVLASGHDFSDLDMRRRTALVNESFVRRWFGTANPLGHTLRVIGDPQPFEIIGVVKDARDRGPKHSFRPVIYTAWENDVFTKLTFNVRTRREVASVIADIRRTLQSVDARVPLTEIRAADEVTGRQLRRERMMASFASIFGGLALAVASVGLFALLAHSVVRRTREIGVRVAVGATRANILSVMIRQSVALLLAGVALGIPPAAAASWAVRSQLHGVESADPLVLTGAAGIIALAAALASIVPAVRALRIDPVQALRHE